MLIMTRQIVTCKCNKTLTTSVYEIARKLQVSILLEVKGQDTRVQLSVSETAVEIYI